MTDSFLSIKNIRKTYGSVIAVEDVTLDIAKGEFLTFLGPSGSGKSTTLFAIAGFEAPTSGEVILDGQALLDIPSHKRNIGMVFQRYTLFPHLTVGENVAFPLRVRRKSASEIKSKVAEMLELVQLQDMADRLPSQMSGGQQQRVALARALAYDPPVLLMDEPLSALDKKLREEIQTQIRRIHKETGVTILYVTHDQEEALRLSDRIALFNQGRIEQVGTGHDLYFNPATRFVAGFIGNSNFLEVEAQGARDGRAKAVFPDGTQMDGVPLHTDGAGNEGSVLMVRPEAIRLETAASQGAGLPIRIFDTTFLGDAIQVDGRTSWGQTVTVRAPLSAGGAQGAGPGDTVNLQWNAEESHLFSNG
ncbi:polyamine ABC transporter ATP-binding protein [Pelagivirga sediminicola]|uniref:Polyamine ABC transporter ATP-binding protein n=1 Tax=Pelagivirga sediminicola TaxID=2170575 RepID=A0A2T7G895_9RHOB|nr:ABC transporter ATP-binding protein [Pelagivirga sediminicola]PVA10634.1 polyamine ABC transporter ATP-binding protein [Pelagivirga sediminicola]